MPGQLGQHSRLAVVQLAVAVFVLCEEVGITSVTQIKQNVDTQKKLTMSVIKNPLFQVMKMSLKKMLVKKMSVKKNPPVPIGMPKMRGKSN